MKTESSLQDIVHAVLRSDHDAAEASIEIAREEVVGDDAVVAVAYRTREGRLRRAFLGLARNSEGTWRPSGGWAGGPGTVDSDEVFTTYGGWGGDRRPSVFGGWVADPSAYAARLVDPMTGRVLTDQVINEVVIFMASDPLPLRYAQVELLDHHQSVLRAGPAQRTERH